MLLGHCPAFRGIIIRGIDQRDIFQDNKDCDNLLSRLGDLLPENISTLYPPDYNVMQYTGRVQSG
jgi:hypothetical protein